MKNIVMKNKAAMETRKALRYVAGSLLMLSALLCASAQENNGCVAGVVIDERGVPVFEAQVTTKDLDLPPNTVEVNAGAIPYVKTDAQGRFLYPGLTLNHHYKVYAEKESDGYPDTMLGMYNPKDDAPVALAAPPEAAEQIIVHMGPKAARLKWEVRDAVSGRRTDNPTIFFQRTDTGARAGGSAIASEGVLVPSEADLVVKMSARGYRDWYYPGVLDRSAAAPLRLLPGEEKTLRVQLQPSTK